MAVQRRTCYLTIFTERFRQMSVALLLSLLLLGLLKPATSFAETKVLVDDTLIVGIEPGTTAEALAQPLQAAGFEMLRTWPEFGLIELRALPTAAGGDAVQAADASTPLAQLHSLAGVNLVERNAPIRAASQPSASFPLSNLAVAAAPPTNQLPTDPLVEHQWALAQLRLPQAWAITRGAPAVTVALIDSGLDVTHEDLRDTLLWTNAAELAGVPGVDDDGNGFVDDVHGWDWVERDAEANDRKGHGTHVGGILAATPSNGYGIVGASHGLSVLPLRVLDEQGSGYISDLVDALYYAHEQNIRVVNLSLVMGSPSLAIEQAIQRLHGNGVLVVAATGNVGSHVLWPAAYPETLAVAATDERDQHASFSNYGPEVDLAAPGVQILSTAIDGGYVPLDGTSMATPFVSGLAGMIWSLRPELTLAELTEILMETADDVNAETAPGRDDQLGAGRLNAEAALKWAAAGVAVQITAADEVQTGNALVASVQLGKPASPARGAVVYYALRPADKAGDAPERWTNSAVSDATGALQLAVGTEGLSGAHVLQLQFGDALHEHAVNIRYPTYTIDVQVEAETLTAGEGSTALRVEVRDAAGALVLDDLPLTLSATLGRFGAEGTVAPSESQGGTEAVAIQAVLQDGVFTGTFYAGELAGRARLVAEVGNVQVQHELIIAPAAPAMLRWDGVPSTLQRSDQAQSISLALLLLDAYGNPVASETPVQLTTSSGQLSAEGQASGGTDGVVAASLSGTLGVTLHLSKTEAPVVIRASAPEIGLQAQATLRVAGSQIMLPLVISGK